MLWLKIIDSPRIGWFEVPSMANHLCPRRKVPQWRVFQSMHLAHWTSGFPSWMWYLWDLMGSDGQPTNNQIIQHVVLLNGETDGEKDFRTHMKWGLSPVRFRGFPGYWEEHQAGLLDLHQHQRSQHCALVDFGSQNGKFEPQKMWQF